MNAMIRGITLCLLAMTSRLQAGDLFKCVNAKGVSSYQQVPCPASAKRATVRYVAPVADDTRAWQSAQIRTAPDYVPDESADDYVRPSGQSNFERVEAQRHQDIMAAGQRGGNRRAFRSDRSAESRPVRPVDNAPRQLHDYQGNYYMQPPGSSFATDLKTGKQCLVNGSVIDCH